MAYKIEGETCPVCKAYLFNEDDVVFCPTCGAPHHRDCYAAIGKCGYHELHGTDGQYTPKTDDEPSTEANTEERSVSRCPRCNRETNGQVLFCPYCGCDMTEPAEMPPMGPAFAGVFVDPYGGLPKDGSVKIEGEKLEDVRKFVFSNTQRYLPVFARLNKKNKTSWNWAAFLLPHCWLFFRKQYTAGLIAAALMLAASFFALPLQLELNTLISESAVVSTQAEQMQLIMSLIPQVSLPAVLMQAAGLVLNLGVMVYFGVFGDWLYRSHTVASVRTINADDTKPEKDDEYLRKGGISVWAFMITYMVTYYLPQIVATFI